MNVYESVQIHQNFMICSSSKFYEFFMNNQFMKYSNEHSWTFMNYSVQNKKFMNWLAIHQLFMNSSWRAFKNTSWTLVHEPWVKYLMNRAWTVHEFTWTFMNAPSKFMTSWTNFRRGSEWWRFSAQQMQHAQYRQPQISDWQMPNWLPTCRRVRLKWFFTNCWRV